MFIELERCISTTLRRSKTRLQARRDKRPGRIADFLRQMTRAFKCSFLTTEKFETSPLCSSWRVSSDPRRKDRKNRRRGLSDVSNKSCFCSDPRRLAQPFVVGQSYANSQSQRLRGFGARPSRRRGQCDRTNVARSSPVRPCCVRRRAVTHRRRYAGGANASGSLVGKRSCVTRGRQGDPGRALGRRDDDFGGRRGGSKP